MCMCVDTCVGIRLINYVRFVGESVCMLVGSSVWCRDSEDTLLAGEQLCVCESLNQTKDVS